ncbi:uncharacterized protein LOC142981127 [Anticarsia gemmatalis]|uniref:uncharacterized protein LOC142981127 n=1 Tax=Anticarsia gemmatalis TaxID=129554 RepID=UPI003F75D66A
MLKMLKVFVFIYFMTILVKCDNGRRKRDYVGRQAKFFSFNVMEEDITIDLDFNIPFIKIPVKKTTDSVYGLTEFPTININPASIALGGAVVLGTTVLIPFLLKYYTYHHDDYRYARILDNAEFGADALLDFAQQMVMNSHGFRGCPLRLACWAAQREVADPHAILNQITNNKLLSSMVNSSAVEDAMISGMHGRSCSSYGPCPLQEHHLPVIMNNLAVLTNNPGYY